MDLERPAENFLDDFDRLKARADAKKYLAIPDKVQDVEPDPGDELPDPPH